MNTSLFELLSRTISKEQIRRDTEEPAEAVIVNVLTRPHHGGQILLLDPVDEFLELP